MTRPPSGWPPPEEARLAGRRVALSPLAQAVADRYFAEFPGDLERYDGDVAVAWELHDTRHVLSWAIGDVEGHVELDRQISWLAGVLGARDFPLEHLARNLELAAGVVAERLDPRVGERLRSAAALVRRRPSSGDAP